MKARITAAAAAKSLGKNVKPSLLVDTPLGCARAITSNTFLRPVHASQMAGVLERVLATRPHKACTDNHASLSIFRTIVTPKLTCRKKTTKTASRLES